MLNGFIFIVFLFGGMGGAFVSQEPVQTEEECNRIALELIINYQNMLLAEETEDPFVFHVCKKADLGQPV